MARILIIDDEPEILSILRTILENAKHEVEEAIDGKVGYEKFLNSNFDLIVTDLVMPEKEGIELIRDVLAVSPNSKIIAISGGGSFEPKFYLDLAGYLGAIRCLPKPLDLREFIKIVEELLDEKTDDKKTIFAEIDFLERIGNDTELAKELIEHFQAFLNETIVVLNSAFSKKDTETIILQGHTLKGAAANLSASNLCEIGSKIEQFGKANDYIEIEPLLEKLTLEIERFKKALTFTDLV